MLNGISTQRPVAQSESSSQSVFVSVMSGEHVMPSHLPDLQRLSSAHVTPLSNFSLQLVENGQ